MRFEVELNDFLLSWSRLVPTTDRSDATATSIIPPLQLLFDENTE